MKKTRLKLSEDEMVCLVFDAKNQLQCIDIINKGDEKALDEEYVEEFGENPVNPFLISSDMFHDVVKIGMIPIMQELVRQIEGQEAVDKIRHRVFNQDNSVN